ARRKPGATVRRWSAGSTGSAMAWDDAVEISSRRHSCRIAFRAASSLRRGRQPARPPAARRIQNYVWLRAATLTLWSGGATARQPFDLIGFTRKRAAQYLRAIRRHQNHVFNAHPDAFFRNVDAGLNREHHSGFKRRAGLGGIVHIQAHMVAETVGEVFAEAFAVKV